MSNVINIKKFLKDKSGLRASPEAIVKFGEILEERGQEIVDICKVNVSKKKRKTIQLDDIEDACSKLPKNKFFGF